MNTLIRSLYALTLALACATASAGPVTIDGGVVFSVAIGQDEDPANAVNTHVRDYFPTAWSPAFTTGVSEGRSSVSSDLGFQSGTEGFQFDAFNVQSTIAPGAPSYDYSQVSLSDRAGVQIQLAFTLAESENYDVAASYFGTGTAGFDNLGVSFIASLVNLQTNEQVYYERRSTSGTNSLSFQLGDPDANVLIGSSSGTLGAGQYRFVWESTASESFLSGGALAASSTSDMRFRVGSFADVPEPGMNFLLSLGLISLLLRGRRKTARC